MCERPIRMVKRILNTRGGERSKPAAGVLLDDGCDFDQLHPSPPLTTNTPTLFSFKCVSFKRHKKEKAALENSCNLVHSVASNSAVVWKYLNVLSPVPLVLCKRLVHFLYRVQYGEIIIFYILVPDYISTKAHLNASKTLMSIHSSWLRQAGFIKCRKPSKKKKRTARK